MFKLESYITPILLDYVSKYVKDIRPEDFQLSLWEGEVALHNLDLRLDVLQEELNLPVEFISGHIHDLSIRVPWTKITSEPIVITINTIEFVLKLKNPKEDGAGSSASSSPQRLNEAKKKRKPIPKPDERATNAEASSSWLVSKIINNITLQCHNIILKYIQEDIVVSMNIQLLSFESASENWQSSMIDVHPIKVLMRKRIKISDLTICLDKRNAAGQIDVNQEPILYRSSFECRILLKYNANDPNTNRITRVAVFTNLLDMNISSMQIPLCMRLVKLISAVKDEKSSRASLPDALEETVDEVVEEPADQSYLTWAWNLLPSLNFTPGYEDEPTNEAPCHTIDIGFYAEQLSFTLKKAELVQDTHVPATKRIRYSPIVRLIIGGMYFETVSATARNWNSLKSGASSINVEPLGIYKVSSSNFVESESPENQRPFIDKSLFDDQCHSIADKGWGVTNYDEYTARITDDYLLYRSHALAFDFIEYQAPTAGGVSSSGNSDDTDDKHNRVQYRFLTAGLTFRYTQTLDQVKQLICEFINSYDYPAYYTETLDGGGLQAAGNGSKLPPPLMEDYDALMRHVPLCTKRFTLQRITIEIHAKGDLELLAHRNQLRRSNSAGVLAKRTVMPPHCVFHIANAEGMINTPLQVDKLVHTTCQLPDKPEKLLKACHEDYEIQVKELTCNLRNPIENRVARILHVPHMKICYGNLLQPHNWKDSAIDLKKFHLNCENFYLEFTRRELNSVLCLWKCAYDQQPQALRQIMRYEATDLTSDDHTRLRSNFNKLNVDWQKSVKANNWNLTLQVMDSQVLYKQRFDIIKQTIFSTKSRKDHLNWLECNLLFGGEAKKANNKTVVGIWLGSYLVKFDAHLLKFLRCRKFEELKRETLFERHMSTAAHLPSNASVLSQPTFVTPITQPSVQLPPPQPPQPPLARRSSRNSLQSRKISHPEETIHVSSERDEKLELNTVTSQSPKATEITESNNPAWLSFIQAYIVCLEMESSTMLIAENLEQDVMLTKILMPKILLKPSYLETVKYASLRQLMMAVATTTLKKDNKNNISWTLILSDFGITNEHEKHVSEVLLEPIQTTITIALIHKSEKLKVNAVDIKEEKELYAQNDKSPARKETSTTVSSTAAVVFTKSTAMLQMSRILPPSGDAGSSSDQASVTVGGRSDRSITDFLTMEMPAPETPTVLEISKPFSKPDCASATKKTCKNRDTFAFNLHADTTPVRFFVSSRKISLFEEHLSILREVLSLITPRAQPNSFREFEEEPIEIVTATEENAVLKEFMDLETSSESSKFSEKEKNSQLIISLFCQWTITRITLEVEANPVNDNSSKIMIELEDLLSTIDQKEDYTKCTSKIGNFNVRYFEESVTGRWTANENLTIRLLGDTTNLPFLNVIHTSVGLKHFFKRIGAKRKGDLNKNLTEIIVTIQALELIVNLEKISKFVAALSGVFDKCAQRNGDSDAAISGNKNTNAYAVAAADLPMIHLDSKGFTLYLPLEREKECCSVAILRIESVKMTPNLENPLQRKPLRSDVFAKAAQLGMLGTPGAIVEDRQYELTLCNVSAASGSWQQILVHMSEKRDNFFRTNPAFEWNNQNRKPELHITDIFSDFSFIATYAPCIVFQNVLICGSNVEYNCATDFVANLNVHQINMLSCLILHFQRILSFMQKARAQKHAIMPKKQPHTRGNLLNVKSTSNTSTAATRDFYGSTIFNSIDEDAEQNLTKTSDSGFQSSAPQLSYNERLKDKFGGSISTLSSVPLTQQPRHIPRVVSLVAGAFLIRFYDVKSPESSIQANCQFIKTPLFSITLAQPSFMFTQNVYDSVRQMTLYDFFINLATCDTIDAAADSVFDEVILDTRPGQANAAGITPPLFSLRSHFTKMQLRECDVDIAKPIFLLLSERKVELLCRYILLINTTLLQDACFEVRPKRTVIRGTKIKLMRQLCYDIDRLHFNCSSIILRFYSENETYNCKLVSSDMKFNIKFLNRPERAAIKASIGALYLLADQKAILHPVNVRLSIDFISEPWHDLPLINVIIKVNLLHFDLGINGVLQLQAAYEGYQRMQQNLSRQWKQFLRNRPCEQYDVALKKRNLELLKCPPACELSMTSSKSSIHREEFYQDDLRAGAFQFVEMSTDSFLPLPYQIQIIRKNFGIICWRYPQPRKMSRIFVYPVPMAMPNPIIIRCRMEYYSEAHETFLHYCDFSLSETVSCQVGLPERQICANIWRVVILQSLIAVDGECFHDFNTEEEDAQRMHTSMKIDDVLYADRKESDFILHPKVLVGCMRIDTTFESTCVPKIQLLLSCNFLTVELINQPKQDDVLPCALKSFNLASTNQHTSQAFAIATLQNLNVHAGIVSAHNYTIDSTVTCNVKCLDYGFLNMLPILEDATLHSFIRVQMLPPTLQRDVSVSLVFDRLKLNFGPSIVHSLLASKQHWDEYFYTNASEHHVLVPKCIVANCTLSHLTFGQTGTAERIQLRTRESCLYSFRSLYHGQELTFFVTDMETAQTEASPTVHISFRYAGDVLVRPVRVGNKCLFIESRKFSNMQIYVVIKGQVELISLVSHHFRLDFRNEDKTAYERVPVEYHIEPHERVCFNCNVQQDSDISMRLRFAYDSANAEVPKNHSGDIPLRSNKQLPWLVKVPQANGDFVSFWVRIFREGIAELSVEGFKPEKILITIWPVFELCSMLTVPTVAFEETTGGKLTLAAAGKVEELDMPVTHLTEHRIRLAFEHAISQESSHEYLLTLKTIDWKQFFYYDEQKWNIENVLATLCQESTLKFPCSDEEELHVQRLVMQPQAPTIQYDCQPSRELSCTMRLEIAAWGYFINATSLPIAVRHSDERILVGSNAIQMLPAIVEHFTLEVAVACGTNWLASAPILLQQKERAPKQFGRYSLLTEKSFSDIVILREREVLKFVLFLKIEQNRRILILRPKYVVANFTQHSMCVIPFAMDHKDSGRREHLLSLDNKVEKRALPPIKSKNDSVGIALDTFYELNAQKSKCTPDTAFVCFVSFKIRAESDISIPLSLSLPFTRRCFSAQNGRESLAFAATLIEQDGIYYLCIFADTAPALLINNQTDLKLFIAQTNASENSSKVTSTTPEFIGRHFEWQQILPAYSNCFYTPPEMYVNFPDVDSATCNITLALFKDNVTKKDIKWSKPIRTDRSWEKFLNIPNHGDVKVIICDKHRIIRVSIFYILQQKEFSVKDLRSRLLVTQPTALDTDESFNSTDSKKILPPQNMATAAQQQQLEPAQRCAHFQDDHNSAASARSTMQTRYHLYAFAKEINLGLHIDDKQRDYIKTEVLSVYIDDFMLVFEDVTDDAQRSENGRSLDLLLPNLQIDNQLHVTGNYDFPVIICAQKLYAKTNFLPQAQYLESTYLELRSRDCMVRVALKYFDDEFSIRELNCSVSPMRAYIEDAYLNELLDALVECAPSNCVYTPKTKAERVVLESGEAILPHDVVAQAVCMAEPLQLRAFRIESVNMLLSVHTSLRLYIALDHSPLSFSSYNRHQVLTVPLRFGQSLGMHYLSGAIFGAGWVVGSLEILGSPSGLARSFSIGLRDFVAMPVQGLFRGPWGFIVGITQGSASLLRNVTAGTVNSLTKLAASVARNLDRLTLDREHIERTEAMRRVRPTSLTDGFSQGLTGLGISMLGAVGGLAHHTLLEARSPVEVMAGVGKGLVGALTKPISGAAELVALTGQGVLQTVGFNALPLKRSPGLVRGSSIEPSAFRIWKLLPNMLTTDQVLFYHEITLAVQQQMHSAYVFLTSTIFAIHVTQCDKLELAYPVSKVVLTRDRDDKTLFYVQFAKKDVGEIEDNLSYTNERIMNFLRSSHSIRESSRTSIGSLQELLQGSMNEEHDTLPHRHLDWAFYINEHLGEHLIQYLKILRNEI